MKKNTVLYIVILLALGITAAVLILRQTNSTISEALTDFAVSDTSAITKIHLTDHHNNDIVLVRKGPGYWTLNGSYLAKQSAIQVLLSTIKEVNVKSTVPMNARDNVIKDLSSNGVKIEIYSGTDKPKTYYVGSPTPDDLGTLMLLQGSSQPFITWIPGFNGYLTTRYIVRLQDWRSTNIYHINPSEITEVKVAYTGDESKSFTLKAADSKYLVYRGSETTNPTKADDLLAKKYLAGFRAINFEVFVDYTPAQLDSATRQGPFATIDLTAGDKKFPQLRLYYKRATMASKGIDATNHDMDKFNAVLADKPNEMIQVQKYVIGKLLAEYNDLAHGKMVPQPQ